MFGEQRNHKYWLDSNVGELKDLVECYIEILKMIDRFNVFKLYKYIINIFLNVIIYFYIN